jgi:16S rRNA (cytosine1402-N4)-methyltransferase
MQHKSVLLNETLTMLSVRKGAHYIDGTLGRAGHSKEIVNRGGVVLGIDRDAQAIEEVEAQKIENLFVRKGCHGDLVSIAKDFGWSEVDGILLDLGVSSPQLDEAERGFSFMKEGPLDMRMDKANSLSAYDVVNMYAQEQLEDIFRMLGEESNAHKIAREICRARSQGVVFKTTLDLSNFIEKIVPRHGSRHHSATKVFQALRMYVNDELGQLERALEGGLEILKPGGVFAVITFESLSDRIVKRFFSEHIGRNVSLQQGGQEWQGRLPMVAALTKKPIVASEEEVNFNPRSRSAKLRAVQKSEK